MRERMRILIGYDGSKCADAAIDDLRRAGLPGEATAYFHTITPTFAHAAPSHSNEVSFQFRNEVLHWLLYRDGRHPCLSEQADSI